MPQANLTKKFVTSATAPAGKDREFYWEPTLPGFGLMVTAAGARSYVVQYRTIAGISRRMTISGRSLSMARREAKAVLGQVAEGGDPLAAKRKKREARADTLRRLVEDEYLADPDVKKLRSANEKLGTFERYVFPTFGSRPVAEIKRSEIVRMLAKIKQTRGPGAANNAFKVLSRFFTWYVPRADDDFRSPIMRGSYSKSKGDGARTLADDEIRILWNVASEGRNAYEHFVRFTLLTAARKNETARMARMELSVDGKEWTIPASRYKGIDGKSAHAHLIPLSPLARDVLAKIPVLQGGGKDSNYVFTTTGKTPISGFSNSKLAFDKRLLAALEKEGDATRERIIAALNERYPGKSYQPFDTKWTTHSLRKTARTLLSRTGVDRQVAEKCLGHIEGGIVGTYDHHEAKPQKRTAFEALAREIKRIVDGGDGKVVPLSSSARA
jgi:integrase